VAERAEDRTQLTEPDTGYEEPREQWPEETGDAGKSKARSYFRQHPRAKWVVLAVLILLIVGGILAWRYYAVRESTDDAQVDAHIVPVSSRIAGTVVKVNVENNTFVNAGTVLVELDKTDYQVAFERAKADYADAEANAVAAQRGLPITTTTTSSQLSSSQASLAAARQQVEAAQARLREAQANYTKVSADLKRMQQLVQRDEVSRQQYDAAVAGEQAAAATVDSARAAVATAQSREAEARAGVATAETAPQQIRVTKAKVDAALAAAQRAKAILDQAQLNLEYTTITAPVTGIVDRRSVEPGQVVQPGQPLFALVDLSDVWVTANFKETQLKDMKVGDPAEIKVDAYDRTYRGHVDSIGGATGARFSLLPPENATGNYVKVVQRVPVRVFFEKGENPGQRLRPGMSVVVTVKTNH
jgi:membrane fusion protein (multidrug efflux system)